MRIAKQEKENEEMVETVEKSEKVNKDLTNTHTFTISVKVGSGETFEGTFTIHRPTIGERIRISVLEAQEVGGLSNVDIFGANLAHMVATFTVLIDKSPVWWKPRELRDVEVLRAVYQNYIDYLLEFQGPLES